MMELLQFFFQDFAHWLGGLIYIWSGAICFGLALGLIAEMFRGK
jgi:hypothetical protein